MFRVSPAAGLQNGPHFLKEGSYMEFEQSAPEDQYVAVDLEAKAEEILNVIALSLLRISATEFHEWESI